MGLTSRPSIEQAALEFLRNSFEAYCITDFDGGVLFINKSASRLLGTDASFATGQPAGGLIDDIFSIYRKLSISNETTRANSFHAMGNSKEASVIAVESFKGTDHVTFRLRPIAEAEEDRHIKAIDELEAIYKHAPIGLALLDAELRYLKINDVLAEQNGLPAEAHLGRTIEEVVPSVAHIARPIFLEVLSTGRTRFGIELSGATAGSNEPGHWLESVSPVFDLGGQARALLVAIINVTRQKNVENLLRDALETQLILHREIVHRVANNFQMIGGILRLQLRHAEGPAAVWLHDAVNRIEAMGLVHRELYHEQTQAGVTELVRYLRGVTAQVAAALSSPDKATTLVFNGDALIDIDSDHAVKLGIVIVELVSNAFKHAYAPGEAGVVKVNVHLKPAEKLVITVSDNGAGLKQDALSSRRGLGMEIINSQIAQLGATLMVAAPSFRGTEFRIEVPTIEGQMPCLREPQLFR